MMLILHRHNPSYIGKAEKTNNTAYYIARCAYIREYTLMHLANEKGYSRIGTKPSKYK